MNRRLSLETNPNPIIEDTTVHPINPAQEKRKHSLEGPSISTIVVEQAPHGSLQEETLGAHLGMFQIPHQFKVISYHLKTKLMKRRWTSSLLLKRCWTWSLLLKKKILIGPSMRMLDFHHPTTRKRVKDNKLLLKPQSVLSMH